MYVETMRRIKKIAREVARMLNISGPFNMQLMAKDNEIKVIECNLRASRSFPFVSKVLKVNFIDIATKVMLGVDPEVPHKSAFELDYVGIKAPQFSFSRLQKADPVLGVEMASTGEVGCLGEDFHEAILKAMLSVGYTIPKKNILLSTGDSRSKMDMLSAAKALQAKGYDIFATRGTAVFLETNGRTRHGAALARSGRTAQHADLYQGKEDRSGGQYPEKPVEGTTEQRLHDPAQRDRLQHSADYQRPARQRIHQCVLPAEQRRRADQKLERILTGSLPKCLIQTPGRL